MTHDPAPTAGATLLVIDDDPPVARFAAAALRLEGFVVDTFLTGIEGLEAARRRLPDAIVLDLLLPRMSGTEVLRSLRTDPATAAIPVLILTASGEDTDEHLARGLGVSDYLRKPISAGDLIAAVRRALGAD